jgi:hypothetical protein
VRRCRLAVCAALAVVAAAAGILPFTQPARADTDTVVITGVTLSTSGPPTLTVTTESDTPISSLQVTFQGSPGPVISNFDLSAATAGPGTFSVQLTSTDATSLDYVPPGSYQVTALAIDSGGGNSGPFSTSLQFLIQATVILNPVTIDYAHQTATFTGQVTGVWPGSGTAIPAPAPISGATVQLLGPFGSATTGPTGTTDAQGHFSIAAPTARIGQQYEASLAPSSQATGDTSSPVVVTETADPVALTASLAHATIKYGQPDTVGGTLSYEPLGTKSFVVLTGATVTLAAAGQKHVTAVTNAKGAFTASLPAQHAKTTWTVSAGGTALLEVAAKSLPLSVQLPTEFKKVSLSLGPFRGLSVKACLNVTSPGSTGAEIIEPVILQYAGAAKGPWKKLATILPHENTAGYCAAGTPVWLGSPTVPVTNGYYRLSFSGTPGLQPASTAAAHRWRYATRVTGFKVTPHQVGYKGAVTVSGRLWHNTGSWHPYAGRAVQVVFQVGSSFFVYTGEPKTNSGGYFSGRFTVQETAQFLGQYAGDKTDFGSASAAVKVTVTGSKAPLVTGAVPGIRRLRRIPR